MVGLGGFEPPTSRLSGVRSNQLSYRPTAETPIIVKPARRNNRTGLATGFQPVIPEGVPTLPLSRKPYAHSRLGNEQALAHLQDVLHAQPVGLQQGQGRDPELTGDSPDVIAFFDDIVARLIF